MNQIAWLDDFGFSGVLLFIRDVLPSFAQTIVPPFCLLVVFLIVIAKKFKIAGAPYLFWHEKLSVQLWEGFLIGLFLSLIIYLGFVFDYFKGGELDATEIVPESSQSQSVVIDDSFSEGHRKKSRHWKHVIGSNQAEGGLVQLGPVSVRKATYQWYWYLFGFLVLLIFLSIVFWRPLESIQRKQNVKIRSSSQKSVSIWNGYGCVFIGFFLGFGSIFGCSLYSVSLNEFGKLYLGKVEMFLNSVFRAWIADDFLITDDSRIVWLWVGIAFSLFFLGCLWVLFIYTIRHHRPGLITSGGLILFVLFSLSFTWAAVILIDKTIFPGAQFYLPLAILVLAGISGNVHKFRYPLEFLKSYYGKSAASKEPEQPSSERLRSPEEVLQWGEDHRPLVVVCTSGGGIKASAWTIALLNQLEEKLSGFERSVKLIFGASGGMVGASYWCATLTKTTGESAAKHSIAPGRLYENATKDQLNRLLVTTFARDLPLLIYPFSWLPWPFGKFTDRGNDIERVWIDLFLDDSGKKGAKPMAKTMGEMRQLEEQGGPAIVFSPMLLEDGRRLIIGNVDMSAVIRNTIRDAGGNKNVPRSFSGVHLQDLFPKCADQIKIATAARLSASFPYFTPAATLPESRVPQFAGKRRAVDAGYYDNLGINLATEYLIKHRAVIREQQPPQPGTMKKVLILQIDASQSASNRWNPVRSDEFDGRNQSLFTKILKRISGCGKLFIAGLSSTLQGVTGPLEGGARAREMIAEFRNDEALQDLPETMKAAGCDCRMITLSNPEDVSLSWYLTSHEITALEEAARDATSSGDSASSGESQSREEWRKATQQQWAELRNWWDKPVESPPKNELTPPLTHGDESS